MDDFDEFLFRLTRHIANVMGAQMTYSAIPHPYVEFTHTEEGVHLTAEMPGVRVQDVRVRVGEAKIALAVFDDGALVYSEDFEASRLDPNAVSVTLKNGILDVKAPYKRAIF